MMIGQSYGKSPSAPCLRTQKMPTVSVVGNGRKWSEVNGTNGRPRSEENHPTTTDYTEKSHVTTDYTDCTDFNYVEVSKVIFHHRLHRLHRFWLRGVYTISQIYWDYRDKAIFHHRLHRLHRFWLRGVYAISQIYWDYSG